MRRIAIALLAAWAGAVAAQDIFICDTAKGREVRVTREGDAVTYAYGPRGKPDITLRRDISDISSGGDGYYSGLHSFMWGIPNWQWLYLVWSQSYGDAKEPYEGGVDVYRKGRRVSRVSCARVRLLRDEPGSLFEESAPVPPYVHKY